MFGGSNTYTHNVLGCRGQVFLLQQTLSTATSRQFSHQISRHFLFPRKSALFRALKKNTGYTRGSPLNIKICQIVRHGSIFFGFVGAWGVYPAGYDAKLRIPGASKASAGTL